MFRCFVIVLFICALFGAVYGSAATIDLNDIISGTNKNPHFTLYVEENDALELTFTTTYYIAYAKCKNELSGTQLDLPIQFGTTIRAIFRGEDRHEGKWICTFTRNITVGIENMLLTYSCSVTIRIERDEGVVLTVSRSDSKYSVEAKSNDMVYFYFDVNQRVSFNCQPLSKNGGVLEIKICLNNGICENVTNFNEQILHENRKESVLHCIYRSKLNSSEARVVFRLNPVPPEITEVIANNRSPRILTAEKVFDGKIGETKQYECKNKNLYGTIHWEFCRNYVDKHCNSSPSHETQLAQDVILKEHNQQTVLKCVHTSNNVSVETTIVLYANKSPSVTINGIALEPYNKTTDVHVVQANVGNLLRIKCQVRYQERDKISLFWKTCTDTCESTQSSNRQYIERAHTLKNEDNGTYLYCAYKNARNVEISTKMVYLVMPKTKKEEVDSEVKLDITKEGATITEFKNGDILDFTCYDVKSDKTKLGISVKGEGLQEIKLQTTPQHKFHGKTMYTAHYKMNFTSRSVDVKCSSFMNNRVVLNYYTLTLYRSIEAGPNLDTTKDSFTGSMPIQPFWIWVAIGSGVIIIVVLVACSIMVFKKGKREEAMIQRASVNYEHFTNDAQEPTPPFPRGAKLEQTYLAPVDLEESPYAISRPQESDTYALPYTPSTVEELYSKPVPKTSRINALYSQILPKSLRGNQNSSKYVNSGANDELQYAEIGHPSKNYANVQDKSKEKTVEEDNYAEILHRSDDYANLNGQKTGGKPKDDNYTNVFSNDPYVNAKRDDYAEPSYCELSRKN